MLQRVYIWEIPVRLTHWLNFFSILVLCFTGFYIGNPLIHAPSGESFLMTQMRFIHFVSAYVFTASCLVRLYWSFAGNEYSRANIFFPFTVKRRRELKECVKFYLFLRKSPPFAAGHSASAAFSYLIAFILFLAEILTGFALYSQTHSGWLWKIGGGFVFALLPSPTIRLIHHGVLWLLLVFAIVHVYIAWLNDVVEKQFVMSSIFSGSKGLDEH